MDQINIIEVAKEQYHVTINNTSFVIEKSQVRQLIQTLDNAIHH